MKNKNFLAFLAIISAMFTAPFNALTMHLDEYDDMTALNWNPQGPITNEKDKSKRGRYDSANIAEDASFTLIAKNRDAVNATYVELFNSERSITKIPNSSWYSNNVAASRFGPFTTQSTLALISSIALLSDARETAIRTGVNAAAAFPIGLAALPQSANTAFTDAMAIFNDANGDLLYIAQNNLSTFSPIITNSDAAPVTAFVRTDTTNTPYKSLLDDISTGLVLAVERMRVVTATNPGVQFAGAINFVRYQSFGGAENNEFSYLAGRAPSNQLTDTIDLPLEFVIDKKTGLFIRLEPSNSLTFFFSVKQYRNNGVIWN